MNRANLIIDCNMRADLDCRVGIEKGTDLPLLLFISISVVPPILGVISRASHSRAKVGIRGNINV